MPPLSCLLTIQHRFDADDQWFSNGYSQNVKFLYDLLEALGHRPCFALDAPSPGEVTIRGRRYRTRAMAEVLAAPSPVDLVFEAGVTVDPGQRAILRERDGARVVSVRYGTSLIFDMEQMLHEETMTPGVHVTGSDVVWTSPHIAYGAPYLRTLYDCPVAVAPYLWEPDFVDVRFDASADPPRRDVYVMEPNMSVIKNALVPLAILEEVFRSAPDSFGKAMILNATRFHQRTYFLENIVRSFRSLLAESEKVYFTPRALFREAITRRDVLLAHQWGCGLNYLYMEALHAGIPFVHNAEELAEAGFYYPGFDVQAGAEQLARALAPHDADAQARRSAAVLERFSVRNPDVQREYARLLDEAMSVAPRA